MAQLFQSSKKYRSRGQALVEFLVASALAALIIPSLLTGLVSSRLGKAQTGQRLEATTIEKEIQDSLRNIRDTDWNAISTNGTFHPVPTSSSWSLSPGSTTIDGYTKSVVISDTFRDTNGVIVESGTIDPSTKKITISVSWNSPIPSLVTETIYLTRQKNLTHIDTTVSDFTNGTLSGSTVTNQSGGEVTLGAGGQGDWCNPNLTLTTLDLPKSGVANAISAIEGQVFAGTGDNASGVSFANVTISNTNPPIASINGTLDGYKTNDVFGETQYAYLATDSNSKEIIIVNLTTNPLTETGYFNAPGNGSGNSVTVSGSVGYMTSGNKLYSFDLSSKSGSRPQLGTVSLAGTGNRIKIIGNYIYVAIQSTTTQLQIIDVTNPRSLSIIGQAQLAALNGKDIFVNNTGTRAYIATEQSASHNEFFIIDVSTKNGNQPILGSYDSSGMNPKALTVVSGNKAIMVGTGGTEYQVINIINENSLTSCGSLNVDTGVNGIASVRENDGDTYSYIITGDASSELKIILGGPGGTYSNSGTFTSSVFDVNTSSVFNRFDVTQAIPNETSITYQIAGADAADGNCANATYTFIGPDGTSSTSFSSGSQIPFSISGVYKNPAKCFRYKASLLSSDSSSSPVMYDFTLNYSP